MRHMGGCTECFTIWWGCRCPLRCEECGAGYRDDGNSNCGTPNCRAGDRRHWAMLDRWLGHEDEAAAEIRCEAIEPVAAELVPESTGGSRSATPSPAAAPDPEREERNVTPSAPTVEEAVTADPSPDPEGGAVTTPPVARPAERRRPAAKGTRDVSTPQPSKPAHRPVAERRAAVEALLAEGLSDREIARRAGVSPSTVSAIRTTREAAKIGA